MRKGHLWTVYNLNHTSKHDHGPSKSCCHTYAAAVSGKVCLTHQGCTLGTAIKAESADSAKLQTRQHTPAKTTRQYAPAKTTARLRRL
jgi:hypothetical protein